ncbi:MAG: flagellar hook-basal body protein [Tissierellia bacterium]|nr:flagellar hook-basal body protein [Tissierellia bacterium]
MNRGLYISATSLVANQKKLDVLSNNLANVNTTGFKKDMSLTETFPEKLLSKINERSKVRAVGENRFSHKVAYLNNRQNEQQQIHTASTQNGYFVVMTPMGKSYVKEIRFTIDTDDEGNRYLKTYYKDNDDNLNMDYENFIADSSGNPIQLEGGNVEELLEANIYNPPSHVIGTMNAGVKFQKIVTDFTQGNMIETGGTFDLAIDGDGFFQIQGQGEDNTTTYYTRDGSFTVNEQGQLTTLKGDIVQGTGGPIRIDGDDVSIGLDGRVIVDGNEVGRLDIVVINNKEFLRKVGDNLYQMAMDENGQEIPPDTGDFEGQVLQGYLEGSNVNAISEMVEMITLLRDYEAGQKAIRMQDEMLEKASNEIGRV